MTEIAQVEGLEGAEEEVGPHSIVRIGTWFWRLPVDALEVANDELISSFVDALRTDSRVEAVSVPPQDDYWTYRKSAFPDYARTTPHGLSAGSDRFAVLELSRHLWFKVRVPIKNQVAPHGDHTQIPSDTYFVAWNGISVFILWEQEDIYPPLAGGHVVAEILADALQSVGSSLYVQSCSPGCEFMFTHTPLLLIEDPTVDTFELGRPGPLSPAVLMSLKYMFGPDKDVRSVSMFLGSVVGDFADFKNVGRRLIDLEAECRADLAHVLGHVYGHAQLVAEGKSLSVLRRRWKARNWRKEARSLVASIWLAMANLETLRRNWDEERSGLAAQEEVSPLFNSDFARDVQSVEALRLDPIAETVNQVAVSLDNRTMVAATGWGALAGGVAGGLAGLLR